MTGPAVAAMIVAAWGGPAGFAAGAALRADAAAARPHFLAAAAAFDRGWAGGDRSPATAAARGRAHFLAGDVPGAVRAFHDGLAVAPWDADLQRSLELARDAVRYPPDGLRPPPPAAVRNRVAPADLLALSAAASMLLAVGLGARLTARPAWAGAAVATGLLGLGGGAGLAWRIDREEAAGRAAPVAVVGRGGAVLRAGNADEYPARRPLPVGAEVRAVGRRGGWVRVELPDGSGGWLAGRAVLLADPPG